MTYSSKLLLSSLLIFSFALYAVRCRELNPKATLLERLKLDKEGTSTCWDSLFELQSCTGEIVMFFLNGETYLGPSCCNAIRTIEQHCWSSMLGSVGINSEESDILLGYCGASEDSDSATPHSPSPPQVVNHTSHNMNP